jgi:hypothetical protein
MERMKGAFYHIDKKLLAHRKRAALRKNLQINLKDV